MSQLPLVILGFQDLLDKIPGPGLQFRSERDQQDFVERDFDRGLEIAKVGALISIAESLEKIHRDSGRTSVKTASRVSW